jgi:8-oxo-dGTP pyrophosphatase MutT (NUDIX family)
VKDGNIRPLSLAIITHHGKVLVMDGYDQKKDQKFYRILGGGIEAGEYGKDALQREFMEELNVKLKNVEYLRTIENIFTLNGKQGHEIILVYRAELTSDELYNLDSIPILDSDAGNSAWWVEISKFKDGTEILYPESIIEYI